MLSDLFFRYGFKEEFNYQIDTLDTKRLHLILQKRSSIKSSFSLVSEKQQSIMVLCNREVYNPSVITHGTFY